MKETRKKKKKKYRISDGRNDWADCVKREPPNNQVRIGSCPIRNVYS